MTDKELDIEAQKFVSKNNELGINLTPHKYFKAGAQFQGEKLFNKIMKELNDIREFEVVDYLSQSEIKARILGC